MAELIPTVVGFSPEKRYIFSQTSYSECQVQYLYHNVTTLGVYASSKAWKYRARPKSQILSWPPLVSSRLGSFRSRDMIQCECRKSTASSSCKEQAIIAGNITPGQAYQKFSILILLLLLAVSSDKIS